MVKGVHVWWSKPHMLFCDIKEDDYMIEDYNLIIFIISALYWKKHYGDIILYTDEVTLNFFKKINLDYLSIWSSVDTELIKSIPTEIDPCIYWASAKLHVLSKLSAPFVILDTDLYFNKPTFKFDDKFDLIFAHLEGITNTTYPPLDTFIDKQIDGYNWSHKHYPINVSVLYFNNNDLLTKYTTDALEFMMHPVNNIKHPYDTNSIRMVFIEQRLLGQLIGEETFVTKPILKDIYLYDETDGARLIPSLDGESNIGDVSGFMEHIWGSKNTITSEYRYYIDHMKKHLGMIKDDFPEYYDKIYDVLNVTSNNKNFSINGVL